MSFKYLILIALLCDFTFAQNQTAASLSCTFSDSAIGYICSLQFNNTEGFDNFTAVDGVHLEGRTNADVVAILTTTGRTTNVPQIVCNQFPNLGYLDLTNLGINSVSENAFSGCGRLTWLRLWNNQIWQLPTNVFANNVELNYLDLDNNWLFEIPSGLFAPLVNLGTLELANNYIGVIADDAFASLGNLTVLLLNNCGLMALNGTWFASLNRLEQLNLYFNYFTSIAENTFASQSNLNILDISYNLAGGLRDIHPNAFRALVNLRQLNLNSAGIRAINPAWFDTLVRLNYLYLNFNQIQELPPGSFANLGDLRSLSLWSNQVKLLRRNAFGFIGNLTLLDLESNGMNAIDQRIFDDAVELRTLYLSQNVCASGSFFDIVNNRQVFLERLRNCFCNFLHYVEIVTGDEFVTFRFFEPGIAFRVNGTENIAITFMPVPFISVPRVSVLFGIDNGTRTAIRVDGRTDVVSAITPNILEPNRWNDFRIVVANWMILVFREQQQFPFLVYNLEQFYPFTHYAVRSPLSQATWNIQPLELPLDTDTC